MNQALCFLPQDHITINLIKSNRLSTVIVKGSVNSPGEYALTSGNESLLSVIKRSGGLKLQLIFQALK